MMEETLTAIYVQRSKGFYSIGLAVIEPFGLRSWVCEIPSDHAHPYSAIDRLLHLLFVAGSKRVLIGAPSEGEIEDIAGNFERFEYEISYKEHQITEQNERFKRVFGIRSLLTPLEHLSLEQRPLAAQALALLCDEIERRSSMTCAAPSILALEELLDLGNNPLEQLEMISIDPKQPDITTLFLRMSTPMGKRLGRHNLFLPIKNVEELNRRYDRIEILKAHALWLSKRLEAVGNLELFWWQLQNQHSDAVNLLIPSLHVVMEIQSYLKTHQIKLDLAAEIVEPAWINELSFRYKQRNWLQQETPFIGRLVEWIAQLDLSVASALLCETYALTRPAIIQTSNDESFLQMIALRHLLVEKQGIEYIPNDIVMGNRDYLDIPYPSTVMLDPRVHDGADIHGVLLYGINSSGKSSLMKSIGIAVILAQAGFFVPAKAMKFTLFDGLYTRIQSRDNVAKSLSTFGVEMLELNTIFEKATNKTLVLGDEISHGTETLSAVAIVASTVLELVKKKALFLLTTHLHQLSLVKELSLLRQVVSLHLSVHYDERRDVLVYDRILRAGRGSSIYGLEFAESLHMNGSFLENAKRLRNVLAKEYDLLELNHKKKYLK